MPRPIPLPNRQPIDRKAVSSTKRLQRILLADRWPGMSSIGLVYPNDDPRRQQQVVAVGLLTERDLSVLGQGFKQAYRLDEGHDFHELLAAIDAAERECRDN